MSVVQTFLEGALHDEWAYLWVQVWVLSARGPEWYLLESYLAKSWAEIDELEWAPERSLGGIYRRRQLVVEPWTWNAVDGWVFEDHR